MLEWHVELHKEWKQSNKSIHGRRKKMFEICPQNEDKSFKFTVPCVFFHFIRSICECFVEMEMFKQMNEREKSAAQRQRTIF